MYMEEKLVTSHESTCNSGITGVGGLVLLTLYFPRWSTVQDNTASLPTGVVRLPIGSPNSGSSGTSLVVLHGSETETQATLVTSHKWHKQGYTWPHDCVRVNGILFVDNTI